MDSGLTFAQTYKLRPGIALTVQIPDTKGGQALKSQINALVTQTGGTGLEYLNQLAADPNIQWDKVALANEKWSYDQAGLTPAGAALLSIVVAAYMPGASGLFGTTTATGTTLGGVALTTTTAGVTTATFAGAALNAGFTALASQAAVAMVNNKGDIGKTLEQLGSEQSIKNLLTTMLTAGALDKLNANYFKGVDATSTFGTQLLKNVTNNLASSAMDAALNGKAFNEEAISKALSSALVTTGMAQGAFAIGDGLDNKTLNAFTHKVAHAVLGCAAGAATAGNGSGCAPGAVGAVVGELTAEYAKKSGMSNADALGLAKVMSAVSGVVVGGGGDNVAAVNIAALMGENAAQNNYLKHTELQAKKAELDACKDEKCRGETQEKWNRVSQRRNSDMSNSCIESGSEVCRSNLQQMAIDMADLQKNGNGRGLTGLTPEEQNNIKQVLAQVTLNIEMIAANANKKLGTTYSSPNDLVVMGLLTLDEAALLTSVRSNNMSATLGALMLNTARIKSTQPPIATPKKPVTTTNEGANGGVIAGEAAPGPVNLMGNGDQFFKNAAKRADIDPNGSFDVIAHGSAQNIEVMTAKGPVTVDQRVAGRLIESSPGYTTGQPVRLLSCDTGACDAGFAQNLANKMGVPVQAPTEIVWAYPNGRMVVAPRMSTDPTSPLFKEPDLTRPGTFKTFTPGKP